VEEIPVIETAGRRCAMRPCKRSKTQDV